MRKSLLLAAVAACSLPVVAIAAEPITITEHYQASPALDGSDRMYPPGFRPMPTQPALSPAAAAFKQEIGDFKASAAALAPDDAADQWLSLVDRAFADWPYSTNSDKRPLATMRSLIEALPPASAWDALAARVSERDADAPLTHELQLLSALLNGDYERASELVAGLTFSDNQYVAVPQRWQAEQLQKFLSGSAQGDTDASADADSVLDSVRQEINQRHYGGNYTPTVYLPDLVTKVGEEKTREFLEEQITKPVAFQVFIGDRTRDLAREIAMEQVDALGAPQWSLVGLQSPEFFEAMERKFPQGVKKRRTSASTFLGFSSGDDGMDYYRLRPYRQAQSTYLLSLIIHDRPTEAAELARTLSKAEGSDDALDYSIRHLAIEGYSEKIRVFLKELLADDPTLNYWDLFISASAQQGKTDEMLAFAREAIGNPALPDKVRSLLQSQLMAALFAADEVEEGIALGRQLLSGSTPLAVDDEDYFGFSEMPSFNIAYRLAQVASLVGDNELFDQTTAIMREQIDGQLSSEFISNIPYYTPRFVELLLRADRGAEAADLWAGVLASKNRPQYANDDTARSAMIELIYVYVQCKQYDEALKIIETYPYLNAPDLATVYTETTGMNMPLGHLVAVALTETGRTDEARTIAEAVIEANGGFDPAYELRLSLGGDDVIPFLDKLFARDAFEERPLIWKAVALHQQGNYAEAEAIAKEAIAIDPSDGEQGPDRRMRVYAVLADVMAATDRPDEAQFFRDVVEAIRISERADRYFDAGLLKRSTQMYNEALTKFADAYCIQSRLARQYSETGETELAEKHYRRAFELMPDSFGRMESHCFGCEGAFRGPVAQSAAEEIFTGFIASTPDKPQVHYLMGYLRESQDRYGEALTHYREAIRLDPLYLNAWKHILSVGRRQQLPQADLDAAALALRRLDPLGRHTRTDTTSVRDLKQLWEIESHAQTLKPATPTALLPLTMPRRRSNRVEVTPYFELPGQSDPSAADPHAAIVNHTAVSTFINLIDTAIGADDTEDAFGRF